MPFVPMAQVIRVYDTKKLSIQQCHALNQYLQSYPRQARYLVLAVPVVPSHFLRTAVGVALYQRLHHVYQQQLKRWSCYWDIPESHCWLEESARVSVFTIAKHVGRPVQLTTVGEPPWSIWRQITCWWVGLKPMIKALLRGQQTSANEAMPLFKKTIFAFMKDAATMKKNSIQITMGLLSVMSVDLTAQATSCEHANVNIENQSTQVLTITEWVPLVYSKIKILTKSETLLVLSPGASIHFDVEQKSSLMQQSGGEIQLYNEKDGNQQMIRLQFVFQEIVLSCVPLDMTKNKGKLSYQKIVVSTRKQPTELTYVFY